MSSIHPAAFEGSAGGEEEDSVDPPSPPPPTLPPEYTGVSPTKSPLTRHSQGVYSPTCSFSQGPYPPNPSQIFDLTSIYISALNPELNDVSSKNNWFEWLV